MQILGDTGNRATLTLSDYICTDLWATIFTQSILRRDDKEPSKGRSSERLEATD